MNDALSDRMAPIVAVSAVVVVLLSGVGGMVEDDRARLLCGVGVVSGLMVLIACLTFASGFLSREAQGRAYAAFGALGGLCVGLFFAGAGNLAVLFVHVVAGAVLGLGGYWMRVFQSPSFWNE